MKCDTTLMSIHGLSGTWAWLSQSSLALDTALELDDFNHVDTLKSYRPSCKIAVRPYTGRARVSRRCHREQLVLTTAFVFYVEQPSSPIYDAPEARY
jgi:hypothetical protein